MAIYVYHCFDCLKDIEKNVPMADRDNQKCDCGNVVTRKQIFTGAVYAPTSTDGGMKR